MKQAFTPNTSSFIKEKLFDAEPAALRCSDCGKTYVYSEQDAKKCPFCFRTNIEVAHGVNKEAGVGRDVLDEFSRIFYRWGPNGARRAPTTPNPPGFDRLDAADWFKVQDGDIILIYDREAKGWWGARKAGWLKFAVPKGASPKSSHIEAIRSLLTGTTYSTNGVPWTEEEIKAHEQGTMKQTPTEEWAKQFTESTPSREVQTERLKTSEMKKVAGFLDKLLGKTQPSQSGSTSQRSPSMSIGNYRQSVPLPRTKGQQSSNLESSSRDTIWIPEITPGIQPQDLVKMEFFLRNALNQGKRYVKMGGRDGILDLEQVWSFISKQVASLPPQYQQVMFPQETSLFPDVGVGASAPAFRMVEEPQEKEEPEVTYKDFIDHTTNPPTLHIPGPDLDANTRFKIISEFHRFVKGRGDISTINIATPEGVVAPFLRGPALVRLKAISSQISNEIQRTQLAPQTSGSKGQKVKQQLQQRVSKQPVAEITETVVNPDLKLLNDLIFKLERKLGIRIAKGRGTNVPIPELFSKANELFSSIRESLPPKVSASYATVIEQLGEMVQNFDEATGKLIKGYTRPKYESPIGDTRGRVKKRRTVSTPTQPAAAIDENTDPEPLYIPDADASEQFDPEEELQKVLESVAKKLKDSTYSSIQVDAPWSRKKGKNIVIEKTKLWDHIQNAYAKYLDELVSGGAKAAAPKEVPVDKLPIMDASLYPKGKKTSDQERIDLLTKVRDTLQGWKKEGYTQYRAPGQGSDEFTVVSIDNTLKVIERKLNDLNSYEYVDTERNKQIKLLQSAGQALDETLDPLEKRKKPGKVADPLKGMNITKEFADSVDPKFRPYIQSLIGTTPETEEASGKEPVETTTPKEPSVEKKVPEVSEAASEGEIKPVTEDAERLKKLISKYKDLLGRGYAKFDYGHGSVNLSEEVEKLQEKLDSLTESSLESKEDVPQEEPDEEDTPYIDEDVPQEEPDEEPDEDVPPEGPDEEPDEGPIAKEPEPPIEPEGGDEGAVKIEEDNIPVEEEDDTTEEPYVDEQSEEADSSEATKAPAVDVDELLDVLGASSDDSSFEGFLKDYFGSPLTSRDEESEPKK